MDGPHQKKYSAQWLVKRACLSVVLAGSYPACSCAPWRGSGGHSGDWGLCCSCPSSLFSAQLQGFSLVIYHL